MNDNIKEMENSNIKKRAKKLRRKYNKLVFIIGLTAVICIVSTYAWFIGINVVKVEPIELSIKVSEGLLISTTAKDAASFTNTIDLDLDNLLKHKQLVLLTLPVLAFLKVVPSYLYILSKQHEQTYV